MNGQRTRVLTYVWLSDLLYADDITILTIGNSHHSEIDWFYCVPLYKVGIFNNVDVVSVGSALNAWHGN
jgi:hypothetical protein